MTLLHDYFHLRNYQAFQRLLNDATIDRGQPGNSGKQRSKPGPLTSGTPCNVNAPDGVGRTVLHLACVSTDALEYVKLLLRHPAINVNLADAESHWTPLHRALYHANLPAARLLLQRADTDQSLHDLEGYTAFDLYNSTLHGTKPNGDVARAELYTWGANRNATLGFTDGKDRVHPEQVVLQRKDSWVEGDKLDHVSRFLPIRARQLQMAKLHTAIVTSESSGNLRLCGFGSGGRLGPAQHTQHSFRPLQNFLHVIVSVALGQDHTLALTQTGEVLSWGLNRFSQLGYVVESSAIGESFARGEQPIQSTPRKVQGALKKEMVKGIAASKVASVCWTDTDVYTWGMNYGQLGYDRGAQAVQVLPRKVTKVTQPVLAVSISDSAMACLLTTHDLICIWNDRPMKIMFPAHAFPSGMKPYRPPQAVQDAKITKITSCADTFAALSLNGELFTFSVPDPSDANSPLVKGKSGFKPQRVWALRKYISSVKDVALGSDGSIIVCTESGHVFLRSHALKASASNKAYRFQRLPALQRVTQVCSNSVGAFGALRVEYQPQHIDVHGNNFSQDLAKIQPYLHAWWARDLSHEELDSHTPYLPTVDDDGSDDGSLRGDIERLRHMLCILALQHKAKKGSSGLLRHSTAHPAFGADVMIQIAPGYTFPAHRIILGVRSHVLYTILDGSIIQKNFASISVQLVAQQSLVQDTGLGVPRLHLKVSGCQPISLLILLRYLYTDDVLAPWDHRVCTALELPLEALEINFPQVKTDLQSLAKLLELSNLTVALESPVKPSPTSSLNDDMQRLYHLRVHGNYDHLAPCIAPDVVLHLSDKDVQCDSTILRARSEFFADFFDEEEWTKKRWNSNGVLTINMRHLGWRVMDYVLRFVYHGAEDEMFYTLDFVKNTDDMLDFIFDVMAAANELLLDRLVLLCSRVILQYINMYNACFILSEATCLHAQQLIDRIQTFMIVNMELFLETGILDDISTALVKQLAEFAQKKQAEKSPISRSIRFISEALTKRADLLELQDRPTPTVRPNHAIRRKDPNFEMSPAPGPSKSPQQSPGMRPDRTMPRPSSNDDVFIMDDPEIPPSIPADHSQAPLSIVKSTSSAGHSPVWKATSVPRVDMKAVMAEAASIATPSRRPSEFIRGSPSHQRTDRLLEPTGNISIVQGGSTPVGWKISTEQTQVRSLPPAASSKEPVASSSSPRYPSSVGRRTLEPTPAIPGLGPIITPTRLTTTAPPATRRTSGKAWTPLPTETPAGSDQSIQGMSFAAIQQLQSKGEPLKDRRSLREIQEEEQALQAEADFLVWWTAEEERIKMEMQITQAQNEGVNESDKKVGSGSRRRGKRVKVDQGQGRQGQGQTKADRQATGASSSSRTKGRSLSEANEAP